VAPVCPVSRDQAVPGMPGTWLPYIPRAVDLPSAIAAVNTIINILQIIQMALPFNNLTPVRPTPPTLGPGNSDAEQDGGVSLPKKSRWELKEVRGHVRRIYRVNRDGTRDKEQWIDLEQITYAKWHDKKYDVDLIYQGDPNKNIRYSKIVESRIYFTPKSLKDGAEE
jgi:hypothetical protein